MPEINKSQIVAYEHHLEISILVVNLSMALCPNLLWFCQNEIGPVEHNVPRGVLISQKFGKDRWSMPTIFTRALLEYQLE
jgi:hypothetical protein